MSFLFDVSAVACGVFIGIHAVLRFDRWLNRPRPPKCELCGQPAVGVFAAPSFEAGMFELHQISLCKEHWEERKAMARQQAQE